MKRLIILFFGLLLLIQPVSATWFNSSWSTKRNLHIDYIPSLTTKNIDNPTEDGYILLNNRYNDLEYIYVGCGDIASNKIYRGYVEWNISSIPDNAIIINAKFKYHGKNNFNDAHITQIVCKPSVSSNQTIYDDVGNGTIYIDQDGFPVANNNQEIDLGVNAVSDLQNALSNNWFAIGLQGDIEDTSGNAATIYSEDYISANPKPTLYIEYTSKSLNYYQMNLNLSYSDISEAQPDFDDIRFVNVSDGASLPYWIEDHVNGSWCNVWVNVTTLYTGWNNDTVALYYGNSEATSINDGDTTFVFYIGTRTTDYVSSLDISSSGYAYKGNIQYDTTDTMIEFGFGDSSIRFPDNSIMLENYPDNRHNRKVYVAGTEKLSVVAALAWSVDTPYTYDIIWNNSICSWYRDGVQWGTDYTGDTPSVSIGMYDYFYAGSGQINWALIRKYIDTPPTYILRDAESYTQPPITPPTKPSFTEIDLIDQLHYEYTHIECKTMHIPIYTGLNYISIPLYQYNTSLNTLFEDHPINNDTIKKYINGTWNISIYNNETWINVSNIEPIEPTVGYEYNRIGDNFTLNISGYMKYNITIFNYENRVGTNIIKPIRSDKDD